MRHLIDPTDLSVAEIGQIIALAEDIIANRAKYSEACKGKKPVSYTHLTLPTT